VGKNGAKMQLFDQ